MGARFIVQSVGGDAAAEGAAMKLDLDASWSLDQGLLRLYKQALAERRPEIAEHLLSALEELAKSDPACEAAVEQAYLCISHGESLPTRSGRSVQVSALTCQLGCKTPGRAQ